MFKHLYHYRRYIWQTAWNDLRYRYAGAALGVFWNFIHPLLELAIYAVVFTQLMAIRSTELQPQLFVLYLCLGLFPWISFAEAVVSGSNVLLENALYLRRLAIPAEIFVAKNSLAATFSLYISLTLLLPVCLLFGRPLSWSWLVVPILALCLQGMAFGMVLTLASLRVLFRDIGGILGALLRLWMWTMPIVYPEDLLPTSLHSWLPLNPPYLFIQSIRNALLQQQLPSWSSWGIMLTWLGLFMLVGLFITQTLQIEVRDNL